ncbi:response regulator [Pseudogulbenkiania sp. MAI-1]|uniref:response regulator n=1 Tax=Pseudogulbenkiania sp. MAI-1 TaxID=990370 RepID=UPI00045E6584|nr:response regulator [Pseudogulbenkiania sp. MAI-1]
MRLLLVEDNRELADWLSRALSASGHAVDVARDGVEADQLLCSEPYALVILDIGLPRLDGFEVLRRLRRRGNRVPVLVLTAQAGVDDRVHGLDLGADDYLGKPFELSELEARTRALLRRSQGRDSGPLICGPLQFDPETRRFELGGAMLTLTPREMAVLEVLMYRQGKPVGKETLAEQVMRLDEDLSADAMEIYVHRLRKKLAGSGVRIVTLRGLGYLLDEEHAE